MTEQMEVICFELISTAGDARSSYIEAIQAAGEGNFEEAERLISTLNEINRKADEEVAAKIRKGKLAM